MKERLSRLLQKVSQRPPSGEGPVEGIPLNYPELVTRAREEWLAARALFENVSDPDLVDHAIHLITATEKKYAYLLRQAKADGAAGDIY